jgi:protein gp37
LSDHSAIQWTNATWNPVRGCTKVSPGCAHCYAETFAERFRGVPGHPYEQGFDLRLVPEKLTEPLRWKKPRRVFVNSMSDLFQDDVPDSFIDRVFAVMALTPQHTYQVLTKRPDRMRRYFTERDEEWPDESRAWWGCGRAIETADEWRPGGAWTNAQRDQIEESPLPTWPLSNVWLGVSVENQRFANERIPLLLQTPAALRFLSCEPLLGPLNIAQFISANYVSVGGRQWIGAGGIGWVIVGGESGPGARPLALEWARSIVRQCQAADVPVFVKQLGSNPAPLRIEGMAVKQRLWLRDRKGGDMEEWPLDLRVREFPQRKAIR